MEAIYFSEDNFKRIFTVIKQTIKDKYNISIRKRDYKNNIIDVMKYSFSIKKQFNIEVLSIEDKIRYLSQKAINFFLVYFKSKNSKKKIKKKKTTQNKERKIDINRPEVTFKKDKGSLEDKFKQLVDSRNIKPEKKQLIDFSDKNTQEFNNNIEEKYLEITKNREDYYNSESNPSSQVNKNVLVNKSGENSELEAFVDNLGSANYSLFGDTTDNKNLDNSETGLDVYYQNTSMDKISDITPVINNGIYQENINTEPISIINNLTDNTNLDDQYIPLTQLSKDKSITKTRRSGKIKTKNIIIDVAGSGYYNGPNEAMHIVQSGAKDAANPGDAVIQEEIKNVVSIKVNRLIIREDPIFRESIIADDYLENMQNKYDNIKEESDIMVGRKNIAADIKNDLSGAYNTAFLHNFNISGVDVAAALEYTKIEQEYINISGLEANASGYLYDVSGGNSIQILDSSGNEYEITYEIARLEYNQCRDSLDQAEFDLSCPYQKKIDTKAIWMSLSGEEVGNDERKNIDAAADIMIENLSGELADISSKKIYAEQELAKLNIDASGLISDIMVFSDSSGAIYERDLEITILERDRSFSKKELLITDISNAYIRYIDSKNLWENISGISIIKDVKADIAAQAAIVGISGEIDILKNDKLFAETHLLNLSGNASTLNIDINILNTSGADYRKDLEIGILNRNRLSDEKQRAVIDLSGKLQKKTETMNLWMDISGIEINNDGLLRIDTAADLMINGIQSDLSGVSVNKNLADTHLQNLSSDANALGLNISILDNSGAEYNKNLELAILNRNIASDETQRALIDLSGALQLKNDTFAIVQNISGYEADASGNNDFAGLVLIKEASVNFNNASGAYVNASGVYNNSLNDLITKQKILDIHRAKLEVFNLSGEKSNLTTKLTHLEDTRNVQLNLSGGDISARVLMKEIQNDYISASGAYAAATLLYNNTITYLDNQQKKVDIYRAKLDVFNISGELNMLEHKLTLIKNAEITALGLSGGNDAAAEIIKKQIEINYVNASGEYFGLVPQTALANTEYNTNQLIVNTHRIKLEVFNLSGEKNNMTNKLSSAVIARNAARDISGGDVAARVILKEAEINMINASGEYTTSKNIKNTKKGDLDLSQKDFIYKKARWDYYNLYTNKNSLEKRLNDISGARYASEQLLNQEWDIAGYMLKVKADTDYKDISGMESLVQDRLSKVALDLSGKKKIQTDKKIKAIQESEPYLLLCSPQLERGTLSGKVLSNVTAYSSTSIFAKLYPDINIMGYTHFINMDKNMHKFSSKTLDGFKFKIINRKGDPYIHECVLMLEVKYI